MTSLAGITTLCFAASYLVALGLETLRWLRRDSGRSAVALFFAAAGVLAHTLFLFNRAIENSGRPLSSPFDWYLVAAWGVAVVYLYMAMHERSARVGLFLLPLSLLLIAASRFAARTPFPATTATKYWLWLHSLALLLGVVSILVGFAAGAMYLVQARRLKRHVAPDASHTLPSLERIDRLAGRASIATVGFIGAGFLSGLVLKLHAEAAGDVVAWTDPTVLGLGVLFAWVLIAALFAWWYRPARHGRKAAYLSIASFILLAALVTLMLAFPTQHPMAQEPAGMDAPTPGAADEAAP